MNILNDINNLILEQEQIPPVIRKFITKMISDFGTGNKSLDMDYMHTAKETLGITGGEVSKIIELIQGGATLEDVIVSIKSNTEKF